MEERRKNKMMKDDHDYHGVMNIWTFNFNSFPFTRNILSFCYDVIKFVCFRFFLCKLSLGFLAFVDSNTPSQTYTHRPTHTHKHTHTDSHTHTHTLYLIFMQNTT